MKTIPMYELQPGDIFTHELKPHNREAFEVIKMKRDSKGELNQCVCISRNDTKARKHEIRKQIKGNVILLK